MKRLPTTAALTSALVLSSILCAQNLFERAGKDHVDRSLERLYRGYLADFDGDGDVDVFGRGQLILNYLGDFAAYGPQLGPYEILATGDFDGDGRLDAFGGVSNDPTVLLNRLPQPFQASTTFPNISFSQIGSSTVADFDGDGDLDILFAIPFGGTWQIANDGSGNFTDVTAARMQGSLQAISDMWSLDADLDGDMDLAFLDARTNQLVLWPNQGGGVFNATQTNFFPPGSERIIGRFDVNSDGHEDLVVKDGEVLLRQGTSFVLAAIPYFGFSNGATHVRGGDIDGDGDIDAWVDYGGRWPLWFRNDGGTIPFAPQFRIPRIARSVDHVELTDVDGDGWLDVLAVEDDISVLLGQPNGEFVDMSPGRTNDLLFDDFNGDGVTDSLTRIGNRYYLRRGDGFGGFQQTPNLQTLAAPAIYSSADLDNDGDKDLLVSGIINLPLHVAFNDGSGNFTVASGTPIASGIGWHRTVDLDGDGDLDLIATQSGSRAWKFMQNDGQGGFTEPSTWIVSALQSSSARSGEVLDADNDGDLDLIVQGTDAQLYLNNGLGKMTLSPSAIPPQSPTLGRSPSEVLVGDVDGDGDTDLVTPYFGSPHSGPPAVREILFLNDGQGMFSVGSTVTSTSMMQWAALVDFDADGDVDVMRLWESPLSPLFEAELLRNDGSGQLTSIPQEVQEPRNLIDSPFDSISTRFQDIDDDGDLDIVGSHSRYVLTNNRRHFRARYVPRLGGNLSLEVLSETSASFSFVIVSTTKLATPVSFGSLGTAFVDPSGGATVTVHSSQPHYVVPIPADPALAGIDLYAQALFTGFAPRLSAPIHERVRF
ncbi:MAG: VCBS repeat-containing protein [bacterium]|nr:VCBS repeat-containing protein [bacterium]